MKNEIKVGQTWISKTTKQAITICAIECKDLITFQYQNGKLDTLKMEDFRKIYKLDEPVCPPIPFNFNSIVIGGIKHSIEYGNLVEKANLLGRFTAQSALIELEQNMTSDMNKSVLMHEVIEAINYHYGLNLKHNQITALATALFQCGFDPH